MFISSLLLLFLISLHFHLLLYKWVPRERNSYALLLSADIYVYTGVCVFVVIIKARKHESLQKKKIHQNIEINIVLAAAKSNSTDNDASRKTNVQQRPCAMKMTTTLTLMTFFLFLFRQSFVYVPRFYFVLVDTGEFKTVNCKIQYRLVLCACDWERKKRLVNIILPCVEILLCTVRPNGY